MWQVVCITEWRREYVVFEVDDRARAEAKADRLNKVTPPSIKYDWCAGRLEPIHKGGLHD